MDRSLVTNSKRIELVLFVVALMVCTAAISLHLRSHQQMRTIYLDEMENTIYRVKMRFLEDNVTNTAVQIDRLRLNRQREQVRYFSTYLQRLEEATVLPPSSFVDFVSYSLAESPGSAQWAVVLWDKISRETLFQSPLLDDERATAIMDDPSLYLAAFSILETERIRGVFGLDQELVDLLVKSEIRNMLHSRVYSDDSYIWVNEVLDFSGGDKYAIRRIHPNLRDTEGMYLSTDMEDIAGNLPYLEELEGVRRDGELFFTYFFRRLNSDEVAEKLTYARLYEPYNWVIAMGVHLDDIATYALETDTAIHQATADWTLRWVLHITAAIFAGLVVVYVIQKRSFSKSVKKLEKETNMDRLTKTFNRRYGEKVLAAAFERFRWTGENPMIMVLDLDDFKTINDNHGHVAGDLVLQKIVEEVRKIIRSSDHFMRWGGDEFVGIFPDLTEESLSAFGEKIVSAMADIVVFVDEKPLTVTVSVGFSWFRDGDSDSSDALQRADAAMYRSKKEGKNRANVLL